MTSDTITTVTDDEIVERVMSLPRFEGYPYVDELMARLDELQAEHPDLVSVMRVGTSRLGEPIRLFTLTPESAAEGASRWKHGLVVGGIHPNEPIGSHTILTLLTDLLGDASLRERLGTVWHIIPCIDPDGMRLNEGWFDDPFDGEVYFRNFYRPPGHEQVEWTFPINYKKRYFDTMLPETQALQRVIDDVRPDFYIPLHNSESGGAYYYLSDAAEDLIPLLHRLPAELGVPLHLGEPEAPHLATLAPAVFAANSPETVYDWREENGMDPAPAGGAGQSSTSYARKHGTLSLIAELPVWRTAGADDVSLTDESYADLLRIAGDELVATGTSLTDMLERVRPSLTLDSPFLRSAQVFVPGMVRSGEGMIVRAGMPENDRIATVAERPMSVVWMYRLRFGGALLRALRAEIVAGAADAVVRGAARELEQLWSDWLQRRQQDEDPQAIPVRDVVGVQYGAVLGLAAHAPARQETRGER